MLAEHVPELRAGEHFLQLLDEQHRHNGNPTPGGGVLKEYSAQPVWRAGRRDEHIDVGDGPKRFAHPVAEPRLLAARSRLAARVSLTASAIVCSSSKSFSSGRARSSSRSRRMSSRAASPRPSSTT